MTRTCGTCEHWHSGSLVCQMIRPASTMTDRGVVHRVRVPLARITGADSLGTDIDLHTEPEFSCGLWEGRTAELPPQGDRITLVNAALACCAFDPEQACSYLERAGLERPRNYVWAGQTVAQVVSGIMVAAEQAGILPAPEEKPPA